VQERTYAAPLIARYYQPKIDLQRLGPQDASAPERLVFLY
jgi:hypothetical protein